MSPTFQPLTISCLSSIILVTLFLPLPSSACQPRVITCLPSTSHQLECSCSRVPQPNSIQSIMEEVSDNLLPNTTEMTLRSCAEEHYSVRLDTGQEHQTRDLEVRECSNIISAGMGGMGGLNSLADADRGGPRSKC